MPHQTRLCFSLHIYAGLRFWGLFDLFNLVTTIALAVGSYSVSEAGIGHGQPDFTLIELRLVKVEFTFKGPFRDDHAGGDYLGLHDTYRTDVNIGLTVVLPQLFWGAAIGIELEDAVIEDKDAALELSPQLVLLGSGFKALGYHVGREVVLAFTVVVTAGKEFEMEDFIEILIGLGAFACEFLEGLAVLVHRVDGLRIVKHDGTCAGHAEFD